MEKFELVSLITVLVAGLVAGIFFISFRATGNAIGVANLEITNTVITCLLIFGLALFLFYFLARNKIKR